MKIRFSSVYRTLLTTAACAVLTGFLSACTEEGADDGAIFSEGQPGEGLSSGPFSTSGGDSGSDLDGPYDGSFDDGPLDGTDQTIPGEEGSFATGSLLPTILNGDGDAWLCHQERNYDDGLPHGRIGFVFYERVDGGNGYRHGLYLIEASEVFNASIGILRWLETGPDSMSIILEPSQEVSHISFSDANHWSGDTTAESYRQVSCERTAFDPDVFAIQGPGG